MSTAPELAGGDFTVVTSEYDRFDRTNERLDVLGIVPTEPGHARLVVVELKRDGTSTTVDLQAIKYAAYVAAAQFSDVVDMFARHHGVTEDDARDALLQLLGGSEDEPQEPLFQATIIAGEGVRSLEWTEPETGESLQESPSLLAARLLHRLGEGSGEVSSAGINGMIYWTVDGHITLRDLAREAGLLERSGRRIEREALRSLCGAIPAGQWTTYGDVAKAIGVPGAAQSVAGILASDWNIPNPHRVLRAGGQISPGWRSGDGGGPETCRARLEGEGLTFGEDDAADPSRRWQPIASKA